MREVKRMKNFSIQEIKDSHQKAAIVREVLHDLPEWFGLPESTKEYIENSKRLRLCAAFSNEQVIGCIVSKYVMGVKKAFHKMGIGRQLFEVFENELKRTYKYIQVKTVDEGHYPEYDQTILFYEKMGFSKLEVFPQMWDPWNPCLIMIKKI